MYPTRQRETPATARSFRRRQMQVVLTLAAGTFASGSNRYTVTDLAMTAAIEKLPYPDGGKCSLVITGLPLDVMEQLSTLAFKPFYRSKNYVNIFAGDDATGLHQVFAGSIETAGADFNSAPDVKFKIEGKIGFFGRIAATPQTAIQGTQDAATFIRGRVEAAGFTFRNNGVSSSLHNSVFSGSSIAQAQTAARQIGAELVLDDDEAILLPTGGTRTGETVALNRSTGLLGYPTITQSGVEIKTLFNPQLKFAGCVLLETDVPKASGTWRITKLSHKIAANHPSDGSWESHITGFYPSMSGAAGRYI